MPWRNPASFPFDRASVMLNAPQESGVYALRTRTTWVYIGESNDVLAQLVQHLTGDNACITIFPDLTFSFELVHPVVRPWRLHDVVKEFRPVCSSRAG